MNVIIICCKNALIKERERRKKEAFYIIVIFFLKHHMLFNDLGCFYSPVTRREASCLSRAVCMDEQTLPCVRTAAASTRSPHSIEKSLTVRLHLFIQQIFIEQQLLWAPFKVPSKYSSKQKEIKNFFHDIYILVRQD